jgi:predicted dithiol-disulfide oxidoreductase (DUF899 family)
MNLHYPTVVGPDEWQEAWESLLVREKTLMRERDALAAQCRLADAIGGIRPEGGLS